MTCAVCADECIGHAGVEMGKWNVHEVRVVQATCTVTFAGRPQQRREQRGWSRRRKESDEVVRERVRVLRSSIPSR